TYDFSGSFSGAWRDIPSRFGERIPTDSIGVSENGRAYRPGGTPTLGEPGPPDTFAVASLGDSTRIVWRDAASDEQRTFTITYRFTGLVKLYRDTADLNLRVWGDQWKVGLDRLDAHVTLPSAVPPASGRRLRVR